MVNAFLFPGQGSQEVGMASDLFRTDESFRRLVQHASAAAGADLEPICRRGPERDLVRPEHLQPLMAAVSLGYLRRLLEGGLRPAVVLGHSLGELAALSAAGALTFEDAVSIAARRGRAMGEAARSAAGGMLAVTAAAPERILAGLSAGWAPGAVLASDNAPGQLVFAGPDEALDHLRARIAAEKLGTARRLAVAGPWHSPCMQPAQAALAKALLTVGWSVPRVPIVMNVSGAPEQEVERMQQLLVRNLTEPVRWRESLVQLRALKPTRLFEIGPGRVLSGLARANGFGPEIPIVNVNNLRGVDQALGCRSG